jgi:CRP-like cAMP-binding protein
MKPDYFETLFIYIESLAKTKIPEEEKRIMKDIFKQKKLEKKEYFLKAGEVPESIAINITGLLRCFYIDIKGNDVTKFFCFEGSVVSYLGLVMRKESKYYIEALEDSILLCADYQSFLTYTKKSPFGMALINTFLEQALIYKEERESSFLLETATQRYQSLIHNYPEIEKRINLGYIASYLGISQVSLSRIRNKLNII